MYALIDIEATGGKYGEENIIDIAIFKFDGEQVVDQFASMVNAPTPITPYVQKLTGITPKMIRRAPKFHEIAKRVIEITSGCVLVGHNIGFDYRMLKQEFASLGYNFQIETLDTLFLSKKLLPEIEAHGLGKLCKQLGIPMKERHRAHGDAMATLQLFKLLIHKDKEKQLIRQFSLPQVAHKEQTHKLLKLEQDLPHKAGVYYMLNRFGNIIFMGNAKNISLSVNQLFTDPTGPTKKLVTWVDHIRYETTGTPLLAHLKYLSEVAEIQPELNQDISHDQLSYGLFLHQHQLKVSSLKSASDEDTLLMVFESSRLAKNQLFNWAKKRNLEHFLHKDRKKGWSLTLNQENLEEITQLQQLPFVHFLIIDKGRNDTEHTFVEVKDQKVIGYGFTDWHHQLEKEEVRAQNRIDTPNHPWAIPLVIRVIGQKKYQKIIPIKS